MSDRWMGDRHRSGRSGGVAANELAGTYGGGLHLMGSISLAPFTDLGELADTAAAGALTKEQKLQLQAYLAGLKNEHSDFDLDAYRHGIVKEKWDVLSACQGAELKQRDEIARQIGADDLRPANPAAVQTLRDSLQKASLPQKRAVAPMW